MNGFLDIPYRRPFVHHYREFDRGFYVDFPRQLRLMGRWLRESGCRTTLDVGAMTGGCIEYISSLGIRMDGVQFTEDIRRLAAAKFRKAGIASTLFVSPVSAPLKVATRTRYDGIVSLGWLNLPFTGAQLRRTLAEVHRLLVPGGVFLFDFFEFGGVIVAPPEVAAMDRQFVYLSHTELLGKRLRKNHTWIDRRLRVFRETSDLVHRSRREVRALLEESGFAVEKREFLKLNYPREFWMARKRRSKAASPAR